MHSLLKRQLKRHSPADEPARAPWRAFIDAVNDAYAQSDADRAMLERSLELSSEELLQSNAELLAVFQALPDLFMRIDHAGVILERRGGDANDPYAERGFALRGRRIQDVPEPDAAAVLADAVTRVAEQQQLITVEYVLGDEAGVRHYEARLSPLLEQQSMVIVRDITERKSAEDALATQAKELLRSNEELQQFAYVASHDLQEPLRTVQSYMQLLRRRNKAKLDSDANEFIDFAIDGAQRMRQLIQDLLSYARVTSDAKPQQEVSLTDTMALVEQALRLSIREKGATLTFEELPCVLADASQIRQLLQNLVGNALKFTADRTPEVRVSATRHGCRWQVEVSDNGIGMDDAFLEKIFVIFKRLHSREEYAGTGIGLAICRKIVERHGGQLRARSVKGEGSTFFFDLPAVDTKMKPQSLRASQLPQSKTEAQ